MWDLPKKFSLGRYRQRRITTLAASLMVAFFSVITIFTTPALAADATRNGNSLTYDGKTFTILNTTGANPDKLPAGLPSSTSGYQFVDTAANKTYFVLTSGDAKTATTGQYVFYDGIPPSNFSNPSPPKTVSIADGPPSDLETAASSSATGCDGNLTQGIGWILCPVVNFLASGMDHLYDILSGFLIVQPIRGDTNSSIYRMWAIVRDLANICFVIAFLVIVYSQVTSLGISNYGIKRMLPRLMVAAILVNVSFWVTSLAVDVSNVIGQSIHTLFMSVFTSLNTTGQYEGVTWSSLTTYILSGGTVATLAGFGVYSVLSTGLAGSLILLIPTLVGVLIAALVAILVMAARQALIICLVVISPLAFVAYLLPNTEKYFDKWKDLFITMLVMFPAFSTVFAGAQLAGLAIIQNAGSSLNLIILGMAVMVAPVVVTPLLIKFSGSLIGKIASLVNNPKKGAIDRTRNWAQGRAQEKKAKILAGQARNTWANRRTQGIDRKRRRREGWKKAYEGMADNNFAGSRDGMAIEAQNRGNTNRKQEIDNTFARTRVGRQLEYQSRMLGVDKQRVENEFEGSHYGHAVSRAHRTVESDKKRIENQHEASWNNAVRTDSALLQQELALKRSSVQADLSKVKLDKMHAEVAAQGDKSEHILNLQGVDAQARSGMLTIARDINRGQIESNLTNIAKSMAEQELNSDINKIMLKDSITIDGKKARAYAAGIGSETTVLAQVVSKDRKEFGEHVAEIKELSSHFKLNAGQIEDLAMGKRIATVHDDSGNSYTFDASDEHVHDMAADEIFTVGSHSQKMKVLMTSGYKQDDKGDFILDANGEKIKDINFEYRRTIQQAAIKSGISGIAPAIADKTLDDLINGKFNGMSSWQYHSFREVLEGRIKMNSLATANAESLKLLFADTDSSPLTQNMFNKLVEDNVPGELKALQETDPTATEAQARASILAKFEEQRNNMREMAVQVLGNTTVRQSANSQSVELLKKFAGPKYTGP